MKKTNHSFVFIVLVLILTIIFACQKDEENQNQVTAVSEKIDGYDALAKGFRIPWAIEIIGENEYLITERFGTLYHYNNGEINPVENIPEVMYMNFEHLTYAGLMDVSLHPQFQSNRLVYIAYVGMDYNMKVAKFELQGKKAENLTIVFNSNAFSIGSRIEWQDNDHFFVTQGSGGSPYPEPGGQDLNSDVGKIHRLNKNGLIPADNPIFNGFTQAGSIWSYGHRDPQGLFFDKNDSILYSNEHGPLGGDEMNVIIKGENYGWPLFSHGLNYDQTPVSNMTEADARSFSQLPIKYWTPGIAPSCLLKLENSNFTNLNGTFLMGSLSEQCIVSYNIVDTVTQMLWQDIGRVRDIAKLPSGDLLVLIDENSPEEGMEGRLIKLKN